MGQEIRCLPNHQDAKLKMLEVITVISCFMLIYIPFGTKRNLRLLSTDIQIGKISLYAASFAVREIQKITLDPK
jgi:competence protein ComGC